MLDYPNVWLILTSLAAGTVASVISFNFVEKLFYSDARTQKTLLLIYAFTIGAGILGLHYIDWILIKGGTPIQLNLAMLPLALLTSSGIGYFLCKSSYTKQISYQQLFANGIMAGILSYATFTLANGVIAPISSVSFNHSGIWIALPVAICANLLGMLVLSWMKSYIGPVKQIVKLGLSFVLASNVFATHISFFSSVENIHQNALSLDQSGHTLLIATVISLAVICLFLLVFAVAIYQQKVISHKVKQPLLSQNRLGAFSSTESIDPLTELPNRFAFQQMLIAATKRSARAEKNIALAFIDLDFFKPVNDNYGHHVGDKVLINVAQRLQSSVRGCDSIARLGGDEFVALIEDIDSNSDIEPIVERMLQSIQNKFLIDNHQIEISCSIGIAIYPRDGDIEKLTIHADEAMYKAKEAGRNQFRFYDAEIEKASDQRAELQRDLKSAIANREFKLVFQPIINCQTQAPEGSEVLIRWQHPTKGLLSPNSFMPLAESFGLTNSINTWLIEECCQTIARANDSGIDLNLSINLAHQKTLNSFFVERTIKCLKKYNVPNNRITFELTETTAIKNEAQFTQMLAKLKLANIRVAVDNFGLHAFSLTHLQNLQVDEIKLAKLFVNDVAKSTSAKKLADAVIKLAHALNFNVVAEGVEFEAQRTVLADLGCNHVQGYLYSKPVSEDKLFKLIRKLNTSYERTGQFSLSDYQVEANVA